MISVGEKRMKHLQNAAGTPMMSPLPDVSSLERLTLFPGEPSTRSRSGMRSPTLTKAGLVAWKACILAGALGKKRANR